MKLDFAPQKDYEYGRSAGLYEASSRACVLAVESHDPAVKQALYALREEFIAKAEAIVAEIEQVAA